MKVISKTHHISYSIAFTQRLARHFDIRTGKTSIEQINKIKYLGVIFNDRLSQKSHIQHVCSKLSSGS